MEQFFQPGRRREGSFTDFGEFAKFGPDGWTHEILQIRGGQASASLASVETPSLRLDAAGWSHGFVSHGMAPSGVVVIGGLDCRHSVPRFQGRAIDRSHIPLLPGGAEFELVVESPGEMLLMTIEQHAFERHVRAIWGEDLSRVNAGFTIPLSHETDAARLRQQFHGFFAALSGQAATLGVLRVARLAEDQLLSAVLTAAMPCPIRVRPAHRHNVARAAVQYLRSRQDEPVALSDLCETLGTSWRALDSGFREVYGISPSSYLRVVRLHGVHRALRAADPAGTSVTEVATSWGFFHFGRFSVGYRGLFGETPSDTLWKRQRSRAGDAQRGERAHHDA